MVAGDFAPGFDNHRMDQHDRFFIRRTRAALEQERILIGQIFALDKKFVERRMLAVNCLRRQHDFAVTGQFQFSGLVAVVQDIDPPDLDAIRADGNSCSQGNFIFRTLELDLVRIKQHFLIFRRPPDRLTGGGPERAALAILHINPCAPLVKGGVGVPARQRKLAPLAISAAGVGDQQAGIALRKHVRLRNGTIHWHAPRLTADQPRTFGRVR